MLQLNTYTLFVLALMVCTLETYLAESPRPKMLGVHVVCDAHTKERNEVAVETLWDTDGYPFGALFQVERSYTGMLGPWTTACSQCSAHLDDAPAAFKEELPSEPVIQNVWYRVRAVDKLGGSLSQWSASIMLDVEDTVQACLWGGNVQSQRESNHSTAIGVAFAAVGISCVVLGSLLCWLFMAPPPKPQTQMTLCGGNTDPNNCGPLYAGDSDDDDMLLGD